jgi:hypothetical protein
MDESCIKYNIMAELIHASEARESSQPHRVSRGRGHEGTPRPRGTATRLDRSIPRNGRVGSTRAARRAGNQRATPIAAVRIRGTPTSTAGSWALVPTAKFWKRSAGRSAIPSPHPRRWRRTPAPTTSACVAGHSRPTHTLVSRRTPTCSRGFAGAHLTAACLCPDDTARRDDDVAVPDDPSIRLRAFVRPPREETLASLPEPVPVRRGHPLVVAEQEEAAMRESFSVAQLVDRGGVPGVGRANY